MKYSTMIGIAVISLFTGAASAETIVYKLYADTHPFVVQLGTQTLTGTVMLELVSDTRYTRSVLENGVYVYRNDHGNASITVTQGSTRVTARIDPGQLFVRYDPTNAVVGFGSHALGLGVGYPLTLSCDYPHNGCAFGSTNSMFTNTFGDIVSALADIKALSSEQTLYSLAVPGEATQLKGSTLLTGGIGSCTTAFDSTTSTCASPTTPINTDHGPLYIQWGNAPYYDGGKGIFTAALVAED